MSNIEKLKAWIEEEKKKGLIDIKLFPSDYAIRKFLGLPDDPNYPRPADVDLEKAAGEILELLTSEGIVWEDITNKPL